MTFYKTTAALGATACLLMASTAFGDPIASDTFESNAGTWDGDKSLVGSVTVGVPSPAGLPITSNPSNPNVSTVLEISGSASNVYNSAQSDTLVDMMVKVSVPDSELTTLEEAASAKFAVAVDTNMVGDVVKGQFKYYTGSGWASLSDTNYSEGDWVRVTMKFYYSTGKCVVALDGNTCGEYNLLNSPNNLASIEVKGSTALDEVLVTQDTMVAKFDSDSAKPEGAEYATKKWLTANNVTWPTDSTAAATLDAQYKFGLDPKGTATTLPLSFEQDADDDKATLSFPGFGAFGGTGTYVLKSSTDKTTWTGSTVVTPSGTGVNTAQINLSDLTAGTAKYYRIEASATAPSNN